MADYSDILRDSWKGFRNNLILFIPYLIGLCLTAILVLLIIGEVVLLVFATGITLSSFLTLDILNIMQTPKFILIASISLVIDMILMLLIRSYIGSIYIGMYKDIAETGKTNIKDMFSYGKKYFNTNLKVAILKLLILFVPFLVLTGIVILGFFASKVAGILLLMFAITVYIIYMIVILYGILFLNPLIAKYNEKPLSLIGMSFKMLKDNMGHTLLTGIIYAAIMLAYLIFFGILNMVFEGASNAAGLAGALAIFFLAIYVAYYIIRMIVGVIMDFFLSIFVFIAFNSCENELKESKKSAIVEEKVEVIKGKTKIIKKRIKKITKKK